MKEPKTKKQKQFFKELPTSKSYAEAARKAGYSAKSARVSAHNNITKYNEFLFTVFEKAGINTDTLAKAVKAGLESEDEVLRFRYIKLMLQLVDKAYNSDEVPFESPELSDEDLDEAIKIKLMCGLGTMSYTANLAVVYRSDLPKGINELGTKEVFEELRQDISPRKSHQPSNGTINYVEEARKRLGPSEPTTDSK